MTAPERPSTIPDSYRRVTPCLTVQGAAKALEFYAAVFGATERMRFPRPGGTIRHAEVQIGDSVVMIEDEDPRRGTKAPPSGGLPGFPAYLFIYVEDVERSSPARWHSERRCSAPRRTSSTVTGTGTSSIRSGTGGPSRRTWRMCRARRWRGGWPSRTDSPGTDMPDEVCVAVRRHQGVHSRPGGHGSGTRTASRGNRCAIAKTASQQAAAVRSRRRITRRILAPHACTTRHCCHSNRDRGFLLFVCGRVTIRDGVILSASGPRRLAARPH